MTAATQTCTREYKMNKHNTNTKFKNKLPRVVSPDELVYTMEVLLQLLEFLQHVVVDGGVAADTDTRCQLLHQLAHRFFLQTHRSNPNAQTRQDRRVDAVPVVLDDLQAQCLTRDHNISNLIHRTASRILLDAKVNSSTSKFNKGFYRKGNQRTRRTKSKKME